MTARTIDLNCDLGELPQLIAAGVDRELLSIVSSANIACGGHAGDEHTMRQSVSDALATGVAIGAHPSYPDRANFGRVEIAMPAIDVERTVLEQITALGRIARELGGELRHVKPHGALYHAALTHRDIAQAIAHAAATWSTSLILVAQAKVQIPSTSREESTRAVSLSEPSAKTVAFHPLDLWRDMGFRVAAEAFADRRYEPDGTLRSRTREGAVLHDANEAADQAVRLALKGTVLDADGSELSIDAKTLCFHGDTPGAVTLAKQIRLAILNAGVDIHSL